MLFNFEKKHRGEEALEILKELLEDSPENPQILYQAAWTCDSLGLESEAVPYYEKAIECGLTGLDKRGAYLGAGKYLSMSGPIRKGRHSFDSGHS